MPDFAALLSASRAGDASAFAEAYALAYDELRRLARRQLGSAGRDRTLVTTVLVNEVFVKLVRQPLDVRDRGHFFALAARAMRQIIVDYARQRRARKRGGDFRVTSLDVDAIAGAQAAEELVGIDEALSRLEILDPRLARIVEWRFFGGMTEDEVGEALGLSARTVRREWQKARAFLQRELMRPAGGLA
ncbi:MAG: ECF-type sigma factor [Vicinamibacterales bacterium]|nr:ECF-type sigma factor [Vicinamibacterales bacterium]